MSHKCNDPAALVLSIRAIYGAKIKNEKHPTGTQHKFEFDDGLVMNIFTTGTVNFQGNDFDNEKKGDIIKLIESINKNHK